MVGVISGWDILTHPIVTIQCFGWRVFFKALFEGHGRTFLSLLPKTSPSERTSSRLSSLVDQCIHLELRAKRIYAAFANAFADQPAARRFFETLAKQEQEHADLLAICSAAARRGGWNTNSVNPWENYTSCLEQHMQEVETCLREVGSLDDALRLVIQIESAEINRVFQAALASCDSAFVKRLAVFQRAMERHVSYVVERLPKLDPRFILATRELQALFPEKW